MTFLADLEDNVLRSELTPIQIHPVDQPPDILLPSDYSPQSSETLEVAFQNPDAMFNPDTDVAQLGIKLSLVHGQTTI